MKNDAYFMTIAVNEAKKSSEPLPCGVAIAKGDRLVATGFNRQHTSNNPTDHAEIIALGKAGKTLGSRSLEGCTIYCTVEPCTMCLSAILFAKVSRLIYGLAWKDVSPSEKRIDIPLQALVEKSHRLLSVTGGYMREACEQVLVDRYKADRNR